MSVILAVIAALAARTVVAAVSAQRGQEYVLTLRLRTVLERGQPGLDFLKLRGIHLVLVASRQQGIDLVLRLANPVGRLGMGAEGLGQRSRLLLLQLPHFFEESGK